LVSAGQVFWLSVQPVRASLPLRVSPESGRALPFPSPSPITAAGPPRICTGFRIAGQPLDFRYIIFRGLCQGKLPGLPEIGKVKNGFPPDPEACAIVCLFPGEFL
jgi:hypothetical protein